MDNFSQEEVEMEFKQNLKSQGFNAKEGGDIKFDETINIEDIQQLLQQHMQEVVLTKDDDEENDVPGGSLDLSPAALAQIETPAADVVIDPSSKKYVVYIDPENIEFIEKLSLGERKLVINKILTERNAMIAKQKQRDATNRYLRHSIVAAITFIIGFPLLFIIVNKSLELTISNYKNASVNFASLYREQGRVKRAQPSLPENVKY